MARGGGPFRRGPSRFAPGAKPSRSAPGTSGAPTDPTLRARVAQRHERRAATVIELDLDRCRLTFGGTNEFGTCPASGEACYQTLNTCKAQNVYQAVPYTWRFCGRGMPLPAGIPMRPYVLTPIVSAPTEIDPDKGLAVRSVTKISMQDEVCPDTEADPYITTRSQAAQGTFWRRLLARNKNYAGRLARVRRGYVVEPWSWDTFQTELYLIESIVGPDRAGRFVVQVSDVVRLLDSAKLPVATDGKLSLEVKGVSNTGFAQSGGAATIQLANAAASVDGSYVGQEVFILSNTASGQRRVITGYVGATRIATVSVAWSVVPDSTSGYEVTPLSATLVAGKADQYPDPAASGKPEYIRLDDEVIRYTAKSGDVLSWSDGTYRAQFGTTRADHSENTTAQLCRVWLDKGATEVISDLHREGGLSLSYVDVAGLQVEDDTWVGTAGRITTCISEPTTVSDLLADLLKDLNLFTWWDAVAQLVKFKANMPQLGAADGELNDDNLIGGSSNTQVVDRERITRAAVYYARRSATSNRNEPKNFQRAAVYIDRAAESPKEYGAVRAETRYSIWLSAANDIFAAAVVARRLGQRRDAPTVLAYELDPRDEKAIGALIDLTSRQIVDETGAPKTVRMRVVTRKDLGKSLEMSMRTTSLGQRFGFIAPAGLPDYGAASDAERLYAFISDSSGLMTDGTGAYLIA